MDGVLVDFAAGALELVNNALNKEQYLTWKEHKALKKRLEIEGRESIELVDLEKPEYRGRNEEEVMPEARAFMKVLIEEAGEEWWANLPWMPGGQKLWNAITTYNPTILTAPMANAHGCEAGKATWVENNLGKHKVIYEDKKYNYAHSGAVLVDDFEINIIPWIEAGGVAVHHHHDSVTSTINKIKEAID